MSNRMLVILAVLVAGVVTLDLLEGRWWFLPVPLLILIAQFFQRCADGARVDGADVLFAFGMRRRRISAVDIVAVRCPPDRRPVVQTRNGSFELSAWMPGLGDFVATVQRLNPALIVEERL